MKIKSLYFKNIFLGWEIERTSFDNLNLLVGLSGSGKSQVLSAIFFLKNIAKGKPMNGVAWDLEFETASGEIYTWKGAYKLAGTTGFYENEYRIMSESLVRHNTNDRIERKRNGSLVFEGQGGISRLTIDRSKSILALIQDDGFVQEASAGFNRIILRDHTQAQQNTEAEFYRFFGDFSNVEILNVNELKQLSWRVSAKLIVAKKKNFDILDEIRENFKAVFEQVANWDITIFYDDDAKFQRNKGHFEHKIKVGTNPKWIPQRLISSGMLRTLNHFIELSLCQPQSVFLIDEFENSLGKNCINALAEDLLNESLNHQFLVTSHHPDIINNIPMEYWRVVTRSNGTIMLKNATDIGLGDSHHEHYLQLINSPIYQNGIQ